MKIGDIVKVIVDHPDGADDIEYTTRGNVGVITDETRDGYTVKTRYDWRGDNFVYSFIYTEKQLELLSSKAIKEYLAELLISL